MRKLILAAAILPFLAGLALAQGAPQTTAPDTSVVSGSFRSNVQNQYGPMAYPDWQARWRSMQNPGVAVQPAVPAAGTPTHG